MRRHALKPATSTYLNAKPRTYLEARAARLATKLAADRQARSHVRSVAK